MLGVPIHRLMENLSNETASRLNRPVYVLFPLGIFPKLNLLTDQKRVATNIRPMNELRILYGQTGTDHNTLLNLLGTR